MHMSHPYLAELIARHTPGHALQREFYTDPRIFDADMERILLRHWFCVAHMSDLPHAGDFLVVELGAESVIIVRNRNDEIRSLVNVCRHRGSRICAAKSGKAAAGRFTCPYHAWTYDLNGRLIAAQQMEEPFDRALHGLKALQVRVVAGLIFTTFAAAPLDFTGAERALVQSARVHGWAQAKVAHRRTYSIQANWKLAVENYMECYHCQPAHAEFSRRHVYARPARLGESLEREGRRRAEALGIVIPDIDQYAGAVPKGSELVSLFRSALEEGVESGTPDSRPIGRLMGQFSRHDGNSTYIDIGPVSDFLAYADHGVIYRFIPRSVLQTDMEVIWLVHEEAIEGADYDVERLTWLWHLTSLEDKKIVEQNQAGVNSQFFTPGPYSMQEPHPKRFVEWYLRELLEGPDGA
jgi:phenylpropionate dioxygenase-like ring-hydroxylating dioxygenase large terminal subunit